MALRSPAKRTPVLIESALQRLGARVLQARKFRSLTREDLAGLADISVSTLRHIEAGSEGVAIGNILRVLQSMGLLDQVEELFDAKRDPEAIAFAERKATESR
ncbi:helix-turn-helix domain-containing protein [Roseateles sp. DC23W]|uniref:Helix-turn-helix domain-containing protein n=1 Tax=Pelomonas dachongensis TaxID=3299029 RepID=A0ABW7EN53_9BURK